jgi:diguanylate cyclase (GGDEF)-like protein/PAS domain S-box-containing protein
VERLRGYTAEEVMAQDVTAALTPRSMQALAEITEARAQAYQEGYQGFYVDEIEQPCKDGSIVWTETTTNFRMNEGSGHLEVFGVSRNITERKRSEAIFQIRLRLLEIAAVDSLEDFMQKALDEIVPFTGSVTGFYHFVEPDQATISLQAWSTRTLEEFCNAEGKGMHHPIDQAGIWADCVRQGKPIIHNDYATAPNRAGLPPGHAQVLRELVVPVYRGGRVVSILGVGNKPADYTERDAEMVSHLADLTWEIIKRKQAEQSLSEALSLLSLLGDNLEDTGLYVYSHDTEGAPHFEYLSAGMERLTGIKNEQALRDASTLLNTILPEYLPVLVEREKESKKTLQSFEMEARQQHAISGKVRWVLLRSTPRRRLDGSTVWYGVEMDLTGRKQNEKLLEEANEQLRVHLMEIEQLHEELREQAIRDPLTGLHNRRYMQDVFRQEFSRARRENYPVSVIMLDLDELKILNDTHGHNVGDQALQTLAFHLQSMTRKEDIVCRYGGDEFTVILGRTFPKDAVRRVEEWRDSLNRHPLETEHGAVVQIKFTAGIASFPMHGSSMEEVINYADVALYRAKARGRNCTNVFENDSVAS